MCKHQFTTLTLHAKLKLHDLICKTQSIANLTFAKGKLSLLNMQEQFAKVNMQNYISKFKVVKLNQK